MGKTFLIAELSANHGHKLETALASVRAAKEAGADAIKIQTYTADTITLDCDSPDFVVKGTELWNDKANRGREGVAEVEAVAFVRVGTGERQGFPVGH